MDNYKEYLNPKVNYLFVKWPLSKPVDPHWIEVPEGSDCFMHWPSGQNVFYRSNQSEYWNSFYKDWRFVKGDEGIDEMVCLWSREPTQDPALISGAEAKLAWAKGKDVQISHKELDGIDWTDLHGSLMLSVFEADHMYIFRLKPQTIKLELELPKPFEPKEGDTFYYLNDGEECGFVKCEHDWTFDPKELNFGAYRTVEEIKQVVEQLRKIRGAT